MESVQEEGKVSPQYAPPYKRLLSTTLDNLILAIPLMVLFLAFGKAIFDSMKEMNSANIALSAEFIRLNISLMLVYLSIYLAYSTVLIGSAGATYGQRALKVKVITETGEELGYKNAFKRALAYLIYNIPYAGFLLALVSAIMLFNDKKREALHDKMCKTIVVNQ